MDSAKYLFNLLKYFSLMKFLSLFIPELKSRSELTLSQAENDQFTLKRAFLIDIYVSAWMAFCTVSFASIVLLDCNTELATFVVVISMCRILEILQVNVNLVIFDSIDRPDQIVANGHRIVITTILNYIETIFLFGNVYALNINLLANSKNLLDAYYFSAVTQFTIGFGDITPIGLLKFIVVCQGFISTIFVIFIFARVLSLFSPFKVLLGKTPDTYSKSGSSKTFD